LYHAKGVAKSLVLDLRRDLGERIKETPAVWRRARNFRGGEPEMQRAVIAGISLSISIPQCDCQRVKFVYPAVTVQTAAQGA
jgi:hypothetical protein